MRQIIILIFLLFQSTLDCISQEPCFTPKGYSQSIFQVQSIKPGLYRTDLIQLGEFYLNPCIKEITINTDSAAVFFGLLGENANKQFNVSLLKVKKGLFTKKKNKCFKEIQFIGKFRSHERGNFGIENSKSIILYFSEVNNEKNSIAIELSKTE